ncbi:MAG: hypothetical protein K0R31_1112 [Clostridiales bacterium]|jgi:hypothetical protein|nr:hypothetical protein [Clostridiales bacterium]
MKKYLIIYIAIICILALGIMFSAVQTFASGDLYYFNGEKLYFDLQSLKFDSSSSFGADIKFSTNNYFIGVNEATIKDMGTVSFERAEIPVTGYSSERVYIKKDHTYAVRCVDGSYGIIKITSFNSNEGTAEFMAKLAVPKESLELFYLDGNRIRFNLETMKSTESSKDSNLYFNINRMTIKGENGTTIKELGNGNYESIKAPINGYTTSDIKLSVDNIYAIRAGSKGFYILKVTNMIDQSDFEFLARKAEQENEVSPETKPEPQITPKPQTNPKETSIDPKPSNSQTDTRNNEVKDKKTSIDELYWVENETRFVMGGKIIFEDPNGVLQPILSPDNNYVVYSNGSYNLLMYDINNNSLSSIYELEGLENQVNYQVYPAGWSQDGSQVAFLTSYRGGFIGGNQLSILNLSDKKVTVVSKGLSSADWGKNGMFAIANGKEVWLVDQQGRNKTTLKVPTARAFFGADNVSFSQDSKKVIYIVADKYYLHDIKTDTYEELNIPEKAASNGSVRAGKDGRIAVIEDRKIHIYYTSSKNYSLIYQDADSSYPGWIEQTAAASEALPPPELKAVKAIYTNSSVLVNDFKVAFEAYNINGNNYFKLRDVAMALKGSRKQFEVTWDGERNAIKLISNKAYTPNGSELDISSDTSSKDAALTTSKIYLDGKEINLTVFNINGSNYFMLRDIGKAINFSVSWDGLNNAILIDTRADYKE